MEPIDRTSAEEVAGHLTWLFTREYEYTDAGHRRLMDRLNRMLAWWEEVVNGRHVATCIGCGCDDLHACVDAFDDPCSWLEVDREFGIGVCSQCPESLKFYQPTLAKMRSNRR